MPRAPKTLLDELARTLKVRQNANLRFNRRVANPDLQRRYISEANDLYGRLNDKAMRNYQSIQEGRFDSAIKDEAWRKTPTSIVAEYNDYIDMLQSRGNEILNDGSLNASEFDFVNDALTFRNYKGLEKFLRRKGRI
jgi:hypothetical protein